MYDLITDIVLNDIVFTLCLNVICVAIFIYTYGNMCRIMLFTLLSIVNIDKMLIFYQLVCEEFIYDVYFYFV